MDEEAHRPRRAMAARDIRPEQRRGEVVEILAAGLARIATAPTAAQELPAVRASALEGAGEKAPDSAATCLELPRDPWLSVPGGEPQESACRRAR
jgi:hypothetical protein